MDVTLSARANFESSNYGRAEYDSQWAAESNNNRKHGELNELKTYFWSRNLKKEKTKKIMLETICDISKLILTMFFKNQTSILKQFWKLKSSK